MSRKAGIAVLLSMLIFVFVISPWLIGLYFQKKYQDILGIYSATHQLNIQIEQFERGWFNSYAKIRINVLDQSFLEYFNFSHQEGKLALEPIIVDQRIHHGPIIYQDFQGLSQLVGLVGIHNTVRKSPQLDKMARSIENFDFINFMGNFYKSFRLVGMHLVYPDSDIDITLGVVEGDGWIYPKHKKVETEFNLYDVSITNPDAVVSIPRLNAHFDADEKLWRGHDSVEIPSISITEKGNETIELAGIDISWSADVDGDVMNVNKAIAINQMRVLGYSLGPFHLMLIANDLNAQAVDNMIEAYQLIMQRGELYQSQLMQKMVMMLPNVFKKGTSIVLNSLDLRTEDGDFTLKGNIVWNMEKESIPDRMNDIISAADIKIDLIVSKLLVKQWVKVASTFPWFNPVNPDLEQTYHLAQQAMVYTKEYNNLGVASLVEDKKIKPTDAKTLLAMQHQGVSSYEYNFELKKLLLNKDITLETNHYLLYLYAQAQNPVDMMKTSFRDNQQKISQEMMSQLNSWIEAGYVKEKNDSYTLSFVQKNQEITINGKPISN